MPYLLMLAGILLFGLGFWMLRQKPKPVKQETEIYLTAPVAIAEPVQPALSSKEKGNAFEKFVVAGFSRKFFNLKQWQGDKFHEGRFAEANMHPDLLFEFSFKDEKTTFAVECKWKASLPESHQWAEERQIANYQLFEQEMKVPVFVILGFGGEPNQPEKVYIIPLQKLKYAHIKKGYLQNFKREESGKGFYFDAGKVALY